MGQLPSNIYAVILAGGSGTRFWPKSRHKSPKQLCKIGSSDETMIEVTLNRLDNFIPPERRIIVTHSDQVHQTRTIVSEKCKIFLSEPHARNTANALALAALEIKKQHRGDDEPIMISLHADHIIDKVDQFKEAIHDSIKLAKQDFLTLIGIIPSYPETGYGYIEKGDHLDPGAKVKSFREKPEISLAREYVDSGKFFWNAGIFVWKVAVLLDELNSKLNNSLTSLQSLFTEFGSFADIPPSQLEETYSQLPKISIDHAVLETSKRVAVVGADIGWQDVGSWDALSKCFKPDSSGNLIYGDVISIDNEGLTADTDGPLVACIGLKDMVVVSSKGAFMVCPKDRAQEVKRVVELLKQNNRVDLI